MKVWTGLYDPRSYARNDELRMLGNGKQITKFWNDPGTEPMMSEGKANN